MLVNVYRYRYVLTADYFFHQSHVHNYYELDRRSMFLNGGYVTFLMELQGMWIIEGEVDVVAFSLLLLQHPLPLDKKSFYLMSRNIQIEVPF